jgi:hypothetical protein
MQYIQHNFIHNWENAIKYEDYFLANDILQDEIAKLIVFDKVGVKRCLLDSNINVNRKASKKVIAKEVLGNIEKNQKLRKEIIGLILHNNLENKRDEILASKNFDGGGKYIVGKENDKKLENDISKYFKGLDANIYLNFSANDENVEKNVLKKIDMHTDNKNKVDNIVRKPIPVKRLGMIYVGMTIVGVASLYFFNKYFIKKYADGGEIEGMGDGMENLGGEQQPIPPQQPITQPQVQPQATWSPPPQAGQPQMAQPSVQPEIPTV